MAQPSQGPGTRRFLLRLGGITQLFLLILLGWLSVDSVSHRRFHADLDLRHRTATENHPASSGSPWTPAPDAGDACPITLLALGHLELLTTTAACKPEPVAVCELPAASSHAVVPPPRRLFPFACGPPARTS